MTEALSANSTAVKPRIVIHAGFGKCGSSSIHRALFKNSARLREDGIYLFGKNLEIAEPGGPPQLADVFLVKARKQKEHVADKLAGAVESAGGGNGQPVGVLSAVSLATRGMPPLFAGLDERCDVSVVFYARPQWQWIPSAWQQWFLKRGRPLDDFVAKCLQVSRPSFRARVEEWQCALPAATFRVRFLISDLLQGKDPARDFFHLLGLSQERYEVEEEARNTSLDFALLHVLSKNPQLFSGIHDNRVGKGLRQALAKKFQSANIRMLSSEQEERIEEFFRDENLWLLKHYGEEIDVDQIYQRYFIPPKAGERYSDIGDMDLIYRCLGIMLEALASRRGDGVAKKPKRARPSAEEIEAPVD